MQVNMFDMDTYRFVYPVVYLICHLFIALKGIDLLRVRSVCRFQAGVIILYAHFSHNEWTSELSLNISSSVFETIIPKFPKF